MSRWLNAASFRADREAVDRLAALPAEVLLTQGFAIMDGATMPVVGDPETMNDTFVEQIVASAAAAIDKAVELDPRSSFVLNATAKTYALLRDYAAAERYYNRSLSLAPDRANAWAAKAWPRGTATNWRISPLSTQ